MPCLGGETDQRVGSTPGDRLGIGLLGDAHNPVRARFNDNSTVANNRVIVCVLPRNGIHGNTLRERAADHHRAGIGGGRMPGQGPSNNPAGSRSPGLYAACILGTAQLMELIEPPQRPL